MPSSNPNEEKRRSRVMDLRVYGELGDIRQVLDRAAIRAGIEEGRRRCSTGCAIHAPRLFWTTEWRWTACR